MVAMSCLEQLFALSGERTAAWLRLPPKWHTPENYRISDADPNGKKKNSGCTWPKANARHSNRAALPQKPPREGVVPAEVFKPILSCLSLGQRVYSSDELLLVWAPSHRNIYQYLSIGVPALFLKLLLTAKREVSLSRPHQQKLSFWKSASALRMLEHLPRKASFARRCLFFKMMLMGLSLDARIPWNTHVCNKHKVKVGCFK